MHHRFRRNDATILLAVAVLLLLSGQTYAAAGGLYDLQDVSSISRFGSFTVNPLTLNSARSITSYSLAAPPIAGFQPQVITEVTTEQTGGGYVVGYGVKSGSPGGSTVPLGSSPYYTVSILDTGSQAHIFSAADGKRLD